MQTHHHYKIAKHITHFLDNRFKVFGFRFGFDPIFGLFPWVGDVISASLAFYMVIIAKRMGMEQKHINRMITNVLIDFFIGLVPIVGQTADFFYKASSKNLRIIEKHGKVNVVEGEIENS